MTSEAFQAHTASIREAGNRISDAIAPYLELAATNRPIPGEDQHRFRALMVEWLENNAKLEALIKTFLKEQEQDVE